MGNCSTCACNEKGEFLTNEVQLEDAKAKKRDKIASSNHGSSNSVSNQVVNQRTNGGPNNLAMFKDKIHLVIKL